MFEFIFEQRENELTTSGEAAGGGPPHFLSNFGVAVSVLSCSTAHKKVSGNKPTAVHSSFTRRNRREALMARGGGKAPKQVTWVICLILYLVALLAHFGVVRVSGNVAAWAWIIGFGLLLAAVQIRGL